MKNRKDIIGVLVIRVPLCSDPIDVPQSHRVFLEEDCKKGISISHILEGNWNFRFLVVWNYVLKFQNFKFFTKKHPNNEF